MYVKEFKAQDFAEQAAGGSSIPLGGRTHDPSMKIDNVQLSLA